MAQTRAGCGARTGTREPYPGRRRKTLLIPACFKASAFAFGSPPKPPRPPPWLPLEFAAAVADEYQLYLLLETGRVVDIVQGDGSAAEETDVGERVEIASG